MWQFCDLAIEPQMDPRNRRTFELLDLSSQARARFGISVLGRQKFTEGMVRNRDNGNFEALRSTLGLQHNALRLLHD